MKRKICFSVLAFVFALSLCAGVDSYSAPAKKKEPTKTVKSADKGKKSKTAKSATAEKADKKAAPKKAPTKKETAPSVKSDSKTADTSSSKTTATKPASGSSSKISKPSSSFSRKAAPEPVAVQQNSNFVSPGVTTYPRIGAKLKNQRPVIGADYRKLKPETNADQIALILDGTDVTANSNWSQGYIFYTPGADLSPGGHKASLIVKVDASRNMPVATWNFTVVGTEPLDFAYPAPNSSMKNSKPIIGLNLKNLPEDLDPRTVRIFIDGEDVSDKSIVNDNSLFFVPKVSLSPGDHKVDVKIKNLNGFKEEKLSWNFAVSSAGVVAEAPSAEGQLACDKYPAGQEPEACKTAAKSKKKINSAMAISGTKRQSNSIAQAAGNAEELFGPAPQVEKIIVQHVAATSTVETPQVAAVSAPETIDTSHMWKSKQEKETPIVSYAPKSPFQYALETKYGFENMAISGDVERSSQRQMSAFIYSLGLRSEQSFLEVPGKKLMFNTPTFKINYQVDGTTDGDITESTWDVKKLTGTLQDSKRKLVLNDIQPKYSSYTLTGQSMNSGLEYSQAFGKTTLDVFGGRLKALRAGNRMKIYGMRVSGEALYKINYGVQYVSSNTQRLREADSDLNSVTSLDMSKKYKYGETKAEYAVSRSSELGSDYAYRLEGTLRKNKTYISSKYENVGAAFRTDAGYASRGLVEFNTTYQYMVSKRLTTVVGYRRRTFREGGSHTMSVPVTFKLTPFAKYPNTAIEYRYKLSYMDDGSVWKDTFNNTINIRHNLGKHKVQLSLIDESRKRNDSIDEIERTMSMSVSSPITSKAKLDYKLNKLNNNLYGPEAKNTYGLSYDLTDWSNFRVSFETLNKFYPTQDRTTQKLQFGKLNPNNNTEINLEMSNNAYLLYKETYFKYNFSKYY